MEWKSFGIGIAATFMVLVTLGASFARVGGSGTVITVPEDKWAVYFLVKNTDATRVRDAVRYWEQNATITTTESAAIFEEFIRNDCAISYVKSAEANIAAEAARLAALNGTNPVE